MAWLFSQLELALLNAPWSPSEYLWDTEFNSEVPGAVMPMWKHFIRVAKFINCCKYFSSPDSALGLYGDQSSTAAGESSPAVTATITTLLINCLTGCSNLFRWGQREQEVLEAFHVGKADVWREVSQNGKAENLKSNK